MTTTRSTDRASQRWFDRALLTDPSRCPSCSAALSGPVCGACGLSLVGSAGKAVWDVSQRAAVLLDRRDALITSMRLAGAAHAPEKTPTTAPVQVPSRPAPVAPPRSVPVTQGPAIAPRPMPRPPSGPPRQSWPLQNVLLGLGALLLAGASIVFLAFTWGSMPLALRASVIAVVTAAVFAAATLSARKALTSSADAIAALGSLLVILDAWALHATGLVAAPDGAAYGALAALGSAGVLVSLGLILRLDVPRAVGCVLLPVAPALLSAEAPSVSVAALLLTAAVATCSIHLAGFCERRAAAVLRVLAPVLVVLTLLATVGAFLVDGPLAAACVLLLVAVVAHAWSVFPQSPVAVWTSVAGGGQTVAMVCAALALADEIPAPSSVWLVPLGALVGAASVMLARRLVPRLPQRASAVAWWTFFAATAAPVITVTLLVLVTVTTARTVTNSASTILWAGLAGLVVALCGSFLRTVVARAEPGASPAAATRATLSPAPWFAALVVLGAGLLLPALLQTVAYWLVLPLVVVAVAGPRLPRSWRTPLRAACFTGIGLAVLLSTVTSTGAAPSVARRDGQLALAASLLVLMVALLVARTWVVSPAVPTAPTVWPHPTASTPAQRTQRRRADLLLGALAVGAAGTGTALAAATRELPAAWPGASLPLLVLSLGLVTLADRTGADATGRVRVRLLSRRLAAVDLHAVLVATAVVNVVTVIATASTPGGWLVTAPATDAPMVWVGVLAVTSAVLLALLGGVLALGGEHLVTPRSVVACAAATPPLAVLAVVTVRSLTTHLAIEWEIISLVVVAFFPVVAAARRSQAVQVRTTMERSSVVLGTGLLLLVAARRPAEVLTVALVIAASATAAWAFLPGRARAGWFALALGVGASWNALASGGVGAVEAYSAPAALVVAAVGAWQVARQRPEGRPLLLAGTTVLVLPTTLLAPTSTQWRPLAVVLVLLLLAAGILVGRVLAAGHESATAVVPGPGSSSPTPSPALPRITTWLLVLGLVVSVVGVAGRAVVLAAAWAADRGLGIAMTEDQARILLSEPTSQPGVWILVAAVAVCGLSWLLGLEWVWLPAAGPRSWAAGLTALVITVPAWILAADGPLGDTATTWSVVSLVLLWGVVALLGTPPGLPSVRTRTEFLRRAVPPLAVAYVVTLGLQYTTAVPVDVLLTLVGSFVAVVAVRAAVVEPAVPTWSNASFGVFATLAPVTLALMGDPEGWRVVLGVVAAGSWLLLGLRARWQAPVAIGGAALVLQVVVLVGPLGLAALTGVPGWVVLAVTGLVLLTLGLTYERQISTARATLRRYAELR